MTNPGMTPSAPAITPVLRFQVTPVGAVFVVGPVMIITVVQILDSELDAGVLRSGVGHDCGWCSDGRRQN
jgi:hypothetical protein